MACVQVAGTTVYADPIEQLENGDWLMRSRGHGPRFEHGTMIRVKPNEIIEMAAAEMPPPSDVQEAKPMTSKLSRLAELAKSTHSQIDSDADKAIDRLTTSKAKVDAGLAKIHGMADNIDKGSQDLDDFANQMSNFPPLDDK
jgi:predicted transcriptional regulator